MTNPTVPRGVRCPVADQQCCRGPRCGNCPGDSTEQALGLYAVQAQAIRELLDEYAPHTKGNLQQRVAAVLGSADTEQRAIARAMHVERERCADILTRRGLDPSNSPEVKQALDEAVAELLGNDIY